ncbi:hypothetical protein [Bradyrhizobium nanningense]|uniref:hypothetical protein n=1 Tax=Bradyrhizobium nanningense TaxID=1325118 RepID=UPI001008F567|nr:hypothetical protein [Bradyrhizobium nanningense]
MAAIIVLVSTLDGWLGLCGPVWRPAWEMKPSYTLGAIVAVVGWVITIVVCVLVYLAALKQIRLANRQIELQRNQIDENRQEPRKAAFARLQRQFFQLAADIYRLLTAQGYLMRFADRFRADGNFRGWSRRCSSRIETPPTSSARRRLRRRSVTHLDPRQIKRRLRQRRSLPSRNANILNSTNVPWGTGCTNLLANKSAPIISNSDFRMMASASSRGICGISSSGT